MIPKHAYECKYCRRTFAREPTYLKHECARMKRHHTLCSPIGQIAYSYYQQWMKLHKRYAPSSEAFADSGSFHKFVAFAQFVRKVSMSHVDRYLKFLLSRKYDINFCANPTVYAEYLNYLDQELTPMDQVKTTISALLRIADAREVPFNEVFGHLTFPEVVDGVQSRKISPWLLLLSPKFRAQLKTRYTPIQRSIIEKTINPTAWMLKFKSQPTDVDAIKKVISQIGLG